MKFKSIRIFYQSEGYTILETMVALALFSIITMPLLFLINQILIDGTTLEKIYAINLAEQELEKTLLYHLDFEDDQLFLWNGRQVVLSRKVRNDQGLSHIRILVRRKTDGEILTKLSTWMRHEGVDHEFRPSSQ